VLLLFSGRPLALPRLFAGAAASLACWFPGTEAGPALADILTGAADPSAGLAVSWPRDVGQIPLAYGARPGGRPENPADKYTSKYLDLPNSPQFAFGHGLAYTRFALGEPVATATADGAAVTARLANRGPRAGTATVFLFLRPPVGPIARPNLSLRQFQRVTLGPGDSLPVRFRLGRGDLASLDAGLAPAVEPGTYRLFVGLSADPSALRATDLALG